MYIMVNRSEHKSDALKINVFILSDILINLGGGFLLPRFVFLIGIIYPESTWSFNKKRAQVYHDKSFHMDFFKPWSHKADWFWAIVFTPSHVIFSISQQK